MGLAILVVPLIAISKPVVMNFQQLSDDLLIFYESVRVQGLESIIPFFQTLSDQLPPPGALSEAFSGEYRNQFAGAVFGVAEGFVFFTSRVAAIIILSIYWSADRVRFERLWLSILPVERRSKARRIWREIEEEVGAHLGSVVLQTILAIIFLWLGYWALGIEYAALLSVLAGIIRLIPWFGAVLAVIPPLLVGLGDSPLVGVTAAIYTLVILLAQAFVVEPRLFPKRKCNSILLVVIVFAMAESFGILGVIFAPPVTITIQILLGWLLLPQDTTEITALSGQITELKSQLAGIKSSIRGKQEQLPQETLSLTDRLAELAEKTRSYLEIGGD
jgi:predicted PurR-regulated permease PerM